MQAIRLQHATLEASIARAHGFGPGSFRTGVECSPFVRYPQVQRAPEACGSPGCRQVLFALNAIAVAAGAGPITLTLNSPVNMRIEEILVVTTGAVGFTLQNFLVNNNPQWALNQVFHSAIFAPGADGNTAFAGDYIGAGQPVSIQYTNLDGAAVQSVYITLKGPGA